MRLSIIVFAWLLAFPAWAQCTITWPPRPAIENVTVYTLYVDDIEVTELTTTAVRMQDVGIDEAVPHTLEVSATNAGGEGPRSPSFEYSPAISPPDQVGAPTVSEC